MARGNRTRSSPSTLQRNTTRMPWEDENHFMGVLASLAGRCDFSSDLAAREMRSDGEQMMNARCRYCVMQPRKSERKTGRSAEQPVIKAAISDSSR